MQLQLSTTGNILSLTSFTAKSLDTLCHKGFITPVSRVSGTGNHRQWSFNQAIGFVVADQIYRTSRSCVPAYIGEVVETFGNCDIKWLRNNFKKGSKYLVLIHQGDIILQGGDGSLGQPDVESAYNKVANYVNEKAACHA